MGQVSSCFRGPTYEDPGSHFHIEMGTHHNYMGQSLVEGGSDVAHSYKHEMTKGAKP